MKRTIAVILALATAVALPGCSSGDTETTETQSESSSAAVYEEDLDNVQSYVIESLGFDAPASWELSEDSTQLTPSVGGLMTFEMVSGVSFTDDGEEQLRSSIDDVLDEEGAEATSDVVKEDVSSAVSCTVTIELDKDGTEYRGFVKCLASGNDLYTLLVYVPASDYDNGYDDVIDMIDESIYVDRSSKPSGTEEAEEDEASQSSDGSDSESGQSSSVTVSQANALKSAKSYVSLMNFSYSGLIDQLEFEGYSTEDATWAADNCGADWYEEALGSAKSYVELMAFSYSGLIDQLEYEGYTAEQASYGADNCGADWFAEAAEAAQNYLDVMSFSRSGLISQLEYEGFTAEQAEYGVSTTGL